ncbi:hypothetical protein GCM10023114_27650 [Mycolicibacterium sediminis]|uniref:Uncharacterized protein n=1 Tax=Mycolicibacterium sediminis TaxID=1286180 RepID=A0A7I7QWT1_9MYCO|nr:hypothetical protein MSEDJ_48480 [Mycolicibacterium sediminis]
MECPGFNRGVRSPRAAADVGSRPRFYVMTVELHPARDAHPQVWSALAWSAWWPWLVLALGVVAVAVGGYYFSPG